MEEFEKETAEINKKIAILKEKRKLREMESELKSMEFEDKHPHAIKFVKNFKASAKGIAATMKEVKEKIDESEKKSKRKGNKEDDWKFNMDA